MKKHKGDIKNWGIIWWPKYKAYVAVGEWQNSRDEGRFIRTSPIVCFRADEYVETQNSIYSLIGESKPEEAQKAFDLCYGDGT